jgi:hypothetical protein
LGRTTPAPIPSEKEKVVNPALKIMNKDEFFKYVAG